ncbi:MAG: hypothetical protein DSZ06_00485 [Sulfurospirillum sp.]|nr:MAG: hypothetical protein DSZ06_00485 [Sulfurospirillum sp.]
MDLKMKLSKALLLLLFSSNLFSAEIDESVKIKVKHPITKTQEETMYQSGIKSISYIGNLNYYIVGDKDSVDAYLKDSNILSYKLDISDEKLDSDLFKTGNGIEEFSMSDNIKITLLLFETMDKDEITEYLQKASINATVSSVNEELRSATIYIIRDDLKRLSKLSKIEYIQKRFSIGSKNAKTRDYEGVNKVSKEFSLKGEGMSVAVVDGGMVRANHVEFQNGSNKRVYDIGDYDFADHATHVAGIIGAKGVKKKAKGMAPNSTIYSFSFYDGAFADMSVDIYNKYDILFSNHSYGYNEKSKLGTYDAEAVKEDRAIYQNPYMNIFIAAGNDGLDSSYPSYGKIKGPANAKNVLTIGALNLNASGKANFSSNGPVKDGRIKPELCARGEGIYSTFSQNNSDYMWMNGTSMATPAATGMSLLLAQAYKSVSGGYDIRHDILTSVLIQSAKDVSREGPDYDTGYGMIDIKGAVDLVETINSNSPKVYINKVSYNKSVDFPFELKNSGEFKATISWVDPASSPSSSVSLVNDLDLELVSSNGKVYYPYTLNPKNPTQLAKQDRANHVDNIEQIYVKNLPSGSYRLRVKGSVVVNSSQDFALASNISLTKKSNILTLQPSKLRNFAKVIQLSIR